MPRVDAAAAATALGFLYLLERARRRRLNAPAAAPSPPPFATLPRTAPAATLAALCRERWLALRHAVLDDAVPVSVLEGCFDAMEQAFAPQQVAYTNSAYGKNHWALSCFMEYSHGVATGHVDLSRGEALLKVMRPTLGLCDETFLQWYAKAHPLPRGGHRELTRLQSFVTRYTPRRDEVKTPTPLFPICGDTISPICQKSKSFFSFFCD